MSSQRGAWRRFPSWPAWTGKPCAGLALGFRGSERLLSGRLPACADRRASGGSVVRGTRALPGDGLSLRRLSVRWPCARGDGLT